MSNNSIIAGLDAAAMRTRWLGLALGTLLVAGCATVRPDFEQSFRGGAVSHDLWMGLLTTRYGCDTVTVIANMQAHGPAVGLPSLTRAPQLTVQVGMNVCTLASLVSPEVVDAWVSPEGIREEWKYRPTTGLLVSVYLEGREERALRVVPPVPTSGR